VHRRLLRPFVVLALLAMLGCTGADPSEITAADPSDGQDGAAATDDDQRADDDADVDEDGEQEGDASAAPEPTEPAGPVRDSYSMSIFDPEFLLPPAVSDLSGQQVLAALYTPLVTYDPETTGVVNAVARSITTEDSQTFTIEVAPDWAFHDGEPITAQTFVDTFTFATDPEAAHAGAALYADVVGTDDAGLRTGESLQGVELVDEMTFAVTLDRPLVTWPSRLGYPAFVPLPTACIEAPDVCEEAPIGNGPYRMDGQRERGAAIRVERWDDHPGPAGIARAIEFRVMPDVDAAVAEVVDGTLDIVSGASGPERDRLPRTDAVEVLERPISTLMYLGLPMQDPAYGGEANAPLRQALSLAIDREELTTEVVPQYDPADSIVPPIVPGHRPGACLLCEHDPRRARALWDAHGGLDELVLWFNSGAGHDPWIEAIADMWRETFGLTRSQVRLESYGFSQYLDEFVAPGAVTGPFRLAWGMTHPSPEDYLRPLLGREGDAAFSRYDDRTFVDLLAAADASTDLLEGLGAYQQAEARALEDMPLIPLFTYRSVAVHGDEVGGVVLDTRNLIRPELVELTR
jgi:oligopeptide transport system substrate-binding protein